jgi:uncharacterized membrane protein
VSNSSRYLAFLAYLLSLPAALFVLFARRGDAFAVYHARQSLAIVIAVVVTPLAWAIVAWTSAWIPLAGPVIGLTLFALVIAAYVGLAASWIMGMIFALRGRMRPVPFVGGWVTRRPKAAAAPEAEQETANATELIERTTPSDA